MSSQAAAPPQSNASVAPSGLSLRIKLALVLALVALVPTTLASQLLLSVNREAVQNSERQLQSSVVAEVTGLTTRNLERGERDLITIAGVVSKTAADPKLLENSLRPVLENSRDLAGVRLEVPSAKVSHVLSRVKGSNLEPATSTAELRKQADEKGTAFRVENGQAIMVARVPKVADEGADAYVSARVDLRPLREQLVTLAEMRFEGQGTHIMLVDRDRHLIAAHGVELGEGADVSALPVWAPLSQHRSGIARVGIVEEFDANGESWVGGLETVPDLGWTVALWRPQSEAYVSLTLMRDRGLLVAGVSAALALLLGLIGGSALARPIRGLVEVTRRIARRDWTKLEEPHPRGDELGQLQGSIYHMAGELKASEEQIAEDARLRGDLGRFLSGELVEAIVKGEHSLALGGERRQVSIVFADVVAFTPLAESRPAEEVVALLNELFSVLTEIVFRHHGTVDKFIGDCIMAVWGAPVAQEDHADRALAAAEDMLHFLETANQGWREKYGVEVRLGIGVNSGEAIVGNIGSDKRMEYTVVGDVVNVAARLESIAKPNQILVAQSSAEQSTAPELLRDLGEHDLMGRHQAVRVFELTWE